MKSGIHLIAKRQDDLHGGSPDYHVYAGAQYVGRIYRTHLTGAVDNWFWGVNGVVTDMEIGILQGNAKGMDDAKAKLREAFDRWLVWALSIQPRDLRYQRVAANLNAMKLPP